MAQDLPLKHRTIWIFGSLAILGGLLSVLADVSSAYIADHSMDSAFSVGFSSVIEILRNKSPSDHLIGSLLGQYFIPFHVLGLILMYSALAPANILLARTTFAIGAYATIIGTSLHASLIYAAAVARDNNPETVAQVGRFFDITAYSLVFAGLVLVLLVAILILSGKSLYPRCTVLLSPLGYMVVTTLALSTVPILEGPIEAFIAASGFNLPFTVFHATTMIVLLRQTPARKDS